MIDYEVVIIGSGIAGMTAGIYLKRNNIKTLIIENDTPGGQLNRSSMIENYPGYVNIDGPSLAYNIYNQVNKLEVNYLFDNIININFDSNIIKTNNKDIKYKYLIIATGRSPRKLDILNNYEGNGVSYCALCDGNLYQNKDILIVGGGKSALEEAIYLSKICKNVTIMNRSDNLRADNQEIDSVNDIKNINIIYSEQVNFVNEEDDKFVINNKLQCVFLLHGNQFLFFRMRPFNIVCILLEIREICTKLVPHFFHIGRFCRTHTHHISKQCINIVQYRKCIL